MNYVVGFCFTQDESEVVLIEKLRPEWQNGLINGVGGKIEPGESSVGAMVREFKEEAGVSTSEADWDCVATIESDDWWMFVFICKSDEYVRLAHTVESEQIVKIPVDDLHQHNTITNLRWLIPMMLDDTVRLNVQHLNFRQNLEWCL